MDPRPLEHPLALRELEQRAQMLDVRVDAAVRDEPEQVDVAVALARAPERTDECLVPEERSIARRTVHALQVLVEDATAADRQVADLRVAHLPGRQSDRLAGGLERRVRELRPQTVEDRRAGELDRVARSGRRAAPPVQNDENYERTAASQIAANDSTSSDAPPTSAPSTFGCDRSSSAFSGLTEPP